MAAGARPLRCGSGGGECRSRLGLEGDHCSGLELRGFLHTVGFNDDRDAGAEGECLRARIDRSDAALNSTRAALDGFNKCAARLDPVDAPGLHVDDAGNALADGGAGGRSANQQDAVVGVGNGQDNRAVPDLGEDAGRDCAGFVAAEGAVDTGDSGRIWKGVQVGS